MLKSHIVLRGVKTKSLSTFLLTKRWTATAAVEFTDSDLSSAKPFEELPSFLSLPIVGTAWVFLPLIGRYDVTRMSESILEKRKILGDIFREKFGRSDAVISFNPDDLQTMYKHEGAYPLRSTLESIKTYRELRKEWFTTLGMGILNGKEWHDLRSKIQKHLMKPRAIQAFLDPMQDVARDLVHKINEVRDCNKEVPDFLGELYKWSLECTLLKTSHTVGFFLYHMARNPDKQEKLYEDIRRILPQKEDKINQSTFNELRYLKACIKESQRINPIVSTHVRESDHDIIFSGYRIPAGTHLFVNIEGIFKDKKYFPRPNEFLPERWLNKDEHFHPFSFLPFVLVLEVALEGG